MVIVKVEPITLPGRHAITWPDYKRREVVVDGERRIITPERLVFVAPRLTPNDIRLTNASWLRLRDLGETYRTRHMADVETLLGQVLVWALQDSECGAAALTQFGAVFHPDGALGEAESTYREMYLAIIGRAL